MGFILETLSAGTIVKSVAGAALAWMLCKILGLAMRTLRVLGRRMNRTSSQAAYLAADAVGVALAWPFEWAVERAERLVARGVEWRAQRQIWRADFRQTMSWSAFQAHLVGNAAPDELAKAVSLFGLTEPFTKEELERRFKRTMQGVHPDKGGSEYLARLANDARALILERKGWKR